MTIDQAPLSREVLLDVPVLPVKPTARVEVRRITMQPGFAAGWHVHNCPVVGSVLDGTVRYQVEGGDEVLLTAGEVFHEPEGVPVRFDAGEEGTTFLAYFLLADGEEPEIALTEV
ncbi:cupin domain-containing protein [Kitasatospora aureofaciens]|uniref:cupin domain-containing protein n=1 Tax=Kitasatospora aureofaciens TaxID=1894 RepID=UPI001C4587B7|nr:cupin domain-containing protein [Kitasatospora aureofaciens]MBV6698218.1 cupin domain-containing protein [Kitasatospora aureofaciens]